MLIRKIMNEDDLLPDEYEFNELLKSLTYQYTQKQAQIGAMYAARRYQIGLMFDISNPRVQEWLKRYSELLANRVNATLREMIREAIIEGITAGDGLRGIRSRIMEAMGVERDERGRLKATKQVKYRADMIARTETARAQHAGRDEQLKESGAVRKVWRANYGACEFCAEIDGMTIEVDTNFFNRGDGIDISSDDKTKVMALDYSDTPFPPLHPNCRCDIDYEWDD